MSKVIVFCGLSASGKTTLASLVSKRLNIFCLHKDAIKERMYESFGGSSLEESIKLGKCIAETMLALAEDSLKNGVDIMIESPFNHLDNPKIFQRWLDTYSVNLSIIVCEINEDERKRRYEMRERHSSHSLYPFRTELFDYSLMPGKKLVVNTAQPIENLVEKILEFVCS
jgi:predicted kinase